MIEIVEDTNILIDLLNTGLIRYCHLMGIEFHSTAYVYAEINEPEQKTRITDLIRNEILIIDPFEGDDFIQLTEIVTDAKGKNNLSETDWSVLLLAERLQCRLLTADKKLMRQARLRGVETNGFLWLCKKMVDSKVVSPVDMSGFLQMYKDTNPRAKEPETTDLINKYKKQKANS